MYDLNLLAIEKKQRLNDLMIARKIIISFARIIGVCVITVASIMIAHAYLDIRNNEVQENLRTNQLVTTTGKTLPINELTKKLNAQLTTLSQLIQYVPFDTFFIDIADHVPAGITVSTLAFSTKTSEVAISAIAKQRNDIPAFETNIKQLGYLENVSVQASLNERSDIPVKISARYVVKPETVQ